MLEEDLSFRGDSDLLLLAFTFLDISQANVMKIIFLICDLLNGKNEQNGLTFEC